MDAIKIILTSLLATFIGAIPFGLVNLTVLDVSYRRGITMAMKIAYGASWIEVFFVLIAFFAGNVIGNAVQNIFWVQFFFIIIPILIGLFFIFRKAKTHTGLKKIPIGFIKGVFLNLVSVQVLLYWIFAMTFIFTNGLVAPGLATLLLFIAFVWLGKTGVLWLYARLSNLIFGRFNYLTNNINRVIGAVLILIGLIQYIK